MVTITKTITVTKIINQYPEKLSRPLINDHTENFSAQMIAALPEVVPESGLSWIPVGKRPSQFAPVV